MKISSNNRIAIVHYLPVEMYPPTINFLNLLAENRTVTLFTTHNFKARIPFENSRVVIHRYRLLIDDENVVLRFWRYSVFIFSVAARLIRLAPQKILYYESFSCIPVFIYRFFFNKEVKLLIHCHEYLSLDWYRRNTVFLRLSNFLERKYLYRASSWISHTNQTRRELFIQDTPFISPPIVRVVPNYPPSRWFYKKQRNGNDSREIKFVYIGTLSLEYSFIKEFCEWILRNDVCYFDIYAHSIEKRTRKYLDMLRSTRIRIFDQGIEYDCIPEVLKDYDIGVILYKAITINYKYNATNKLFEYLACGLDVWFPEEMKGCYEYVTSNTYPRVSKYNFLKLPCIDNKYWSDLDGLTYKPTNFFCEGAIAEMKNQLIN